MLVSRLLSFSLSNLQHRVHLVFQKQMENLALHSRVYEIAWESNADLIYRARPMCTISVVSAFTSALFLKW